jgi:hypothetical protein
MQDVQREQNSKFTMAKVSFNKKTLFTSKLYLNLRGKNTSKVQLWSVALYGAEN